MLKGSCLCGAVRFSVSGRPSDPAACHCSQCRKQSGHVWAAAVVRADDIEIDGALRWYEASPKARRGFCPSCGSFLFWQAYDSGKMDFALGAIDGPTGLKLKRHIYVENKGDYYDIAPSEPQQDRESDAG